MSFRVQDCKGRRITEVVILLLHLLQLSAPLDGRPLTRSQSVASTLPLIHLVAGGLRQIYSELPATLLVWEGYEIAFMRMPGTK